MMNVADFDALLVQKQNFNNLDNLAASAANQQMTQQAVKSVQAVQAMPTATGYMPENATLPMFQKQAEAEKAAAEAAAKAQQAPQFFIAYNGEQKGPLSIDQLRGLVIVGIIDENTQVWRQGTPNWTDLKTCLTNL